MEFGDQPVDLSHKPSFMKVIQDILNLIPRSKVEEFFRNHTDNFFVDVTDTRDDKKILYFHKNCNEH